MALAQQTYPERVLIVLNPDGSMKGAHQEQLTVIKDGADILSAKPLPAAPLDAGTLASILPNQAALTAQVQALTDSLAAMTTLRDGLQTAKDAAAAEAAANLAAKTSAEAQATAATAHASDLAVQLAAANLQLQTNATTPLPAEGLKGYAAQKRYAVETGGVTIGGKVYPTDERSQAKFTGAFALSQINPQATFPWKLADGSFVTLNAQQLVQVAIAVGQFVETAFAHEAAAVAAIDAGTAHTPNDVDAFFA